MPRYSALLLHCTSSSEPRLSSTARTALSIGTDDDMVALKKARKDCPRPWRALLFGRKIIYCERG